MTTAAAHAHAGGTTTMIAAARGGATTTMIAAARGGATTTMTAARAHATMTTTIVACAAGAAGSATPKVMPRRPAGGGKTREVVARARAAATTTTTGGRVRAAARMKVTAGGSATRVVTRRLRGVVGKIAARQQQRRWPAAWWALWAFPVSKPSAIDTALSHFPSADLVPSPGRRTWPIGMTIGSFFDRRSSAPHHPAPRESANLRGSGNRLGHSVVDSVLAFPSFGWQVGLRMHRYPSLQLGSRTPPTATRCGLLARQRSPAVAADRRLPYCIGHGTRSHNVTFASSSHCARNGFHAGDHHDRFSVPARHAPQPRRS
jgi:hypothetical protein